ncbi:MAG: SRPBCC family protein [Candidatus Omnitrophica bacterium]|nr:SRPBCC family protein [Candidatus Omnitrophota bacterium]
MKIRVLKRRQHLPYALDDVFPFFEKPENLSRLTPGSLHFEILTPSPVPMKAGSVIDYVIQISGIPMHWTTLIADYDPPYRFVDVQLKGPYEFWHHTHLFETAPDGGVWMTDEVRYAMPLGWIGEAVHALWVGRQLEHIFDFRAHVVAGFLGDEKRVTG